MTAIASTNAPILNLRPLFIRSQPALIVDCSGDFFSNAVQEVGDKAAGCFAANCLATGRLHPNSEMLRHWMIIAARQMATFRPLISDLSGVGNPLSCSSARVSQVAADFLGKGRKSDVLKLGTVHAKGGIASFDVR